MSNSWLLWPKLAARCTYRQTLRESWLELPKSLHLVSGYVSLAWWAMYKTSKVSHEGQCSRSRSMHGMMGLGRSQCYKFHLWWCKRFGDISAWLRAPQNGAAKGPMMCMMMFKLRLPFLGGGESCIVVYVTSELEYRHMFKITAVLCLSYQ